MKINDIRLEKMNDRARLVAKVIWEDSGRPEQEIYFETAQDFSGGLSCDPDAFLTAAIMPAMRHGERRVVVDGEICPFLQMGLRDAMSLINYWYGPAYNPVFIEGRIRRAPSPRVSDRAAFFLTGGIDSLTTLRTNRLDSPREHPGSFRDGLLIFGLEIDDPVAFEHVVKSLAMLGAEEGFTMLVVSTNVRLLDDDWVFWGDKFMGAVLSSVAHALGKRLTSASIGSCVDYPYLRPHGSHPLLDSLFSSYGLRIHHDCPALSRFAKTKILAGWETGLRYLHVCNKSEYYRSGVLNCGRCEKCLRTLTALLILGKLDAAVSFAQREVTPELILANAFVHKITFPFWQELVGPLEEAGRADLARAVRRQISLWRGERGWRGPLRRFDRKHLNGVLRYLKRKHFAASLPC